MKIALFNLSSIHIVTQPSVFTGIKLVRSYIVPNTLIEERLRHIKYTSIIITRSYYDVFIVIGNTVLVQP